MSESQLNSRDITFRTVFHDVEGIKAYLRKLRHENERVMRNIQSLVQNEVYEAFNSAATLNSMVQGAVNDIISPLKTEWVDNNFITFIADNISDTTINLISNRFMSIVNYNSDEFNSYINSALTGDTVEALISPLKTEWVDNNFITFIADNISDTTINLISNRFMSIVDYNSGQFNVYINNALTSNAVEALISPLKTEWIDNNFINYITGFISECNCSGGLSSDITDDIQKEIADQFPEIDVKNILKKYHLIEKHHTTFTSNVTIDISDLTNPSSALERFRILAYIRGEKATDTLHYTYTSNAIIEDAYNNTDGDLTAAILTIATMIIENNTHLNVNFNTTDNIDLNSYLGGTLWYGFTDLINPGSSTDYTVMVSIDGSSNYLPLLTSAGERFTVGSNYKMGYISGAAEAIREQFGSEINVVEVVPHPLLVNDSERYTVLRAITDSTKKGNWNYRNDNGSNSDSYFYNKKYDRSVLKFSPLETPIMYASVRSENGDIENYYYYKLYQTFKDRADIYSIDLSNFVPWTIELPPGLTISSNTPPEFNNINANSFNFGKSDIGEICNGSTNLANIDLRCIESIREIATANAFTGCTRLRTVYCNESLGNLISNVLPTREGHEWNYVTDISAYVMQQTS